MQYCNGKVYMRYRDTEIEDVVIDYFAYLNSKRAKMGKHPVTADYRRVTRCAIILILENMDNIGPWTENYLQGKARSTQAWWLGLAKQFFSWMVLTGQIDKNPMTEFKSRTVPQVCRETYDMEDIKKILSITMTWQQRILLRVMIESGARRIELLRITQDDIMPEQGLLILHGKGNKDRVTSISPLTAQEIVKDFKDYPRKYLFQRADGRPWGPEMLNHLWKDVLTSAGVKHKGASFHIMRRSFITEMHKQNVPLGLIQKLAGHENLLTTQRYIQFCKKDIERIHETKIFQMLHTMYNDREGKL